jgi:hypothetical protein
MAYAGIFTEFKIASFRRLAFWKRDLEVLMFADGGPRGRKGGVESMGEDIEEPPGLELVPVKDR